MGGKGSGPLKRCVVCNEPLVCFNCGADQNDKSLVPVNFKLSKERLDELKAQAEKQGVSLSELMRDMVGG